MIEPKLYSRKPFDVEAVQVTSENMAEIAEWCGGTIRDDVVLKGRALDRHIKVEVSRPLNPRQELAYVTDWVLRAGNGFKIYTDIAFHKSFDAKEESPFKIWNGVEWLPMDEELARKYLGPIVVEGIKRDVENGFHAAGEPLEELRSVDVPAETPQVKLSTD